MVPLFAGKHFNRDQLWFWSRRRSANVAMRREARGLDQRPDHVAASDYLWWQLREQLGYATMFAETHRNQIFGGLSKQAAAHNWFDHVPPLVSSQNIPAVWHSTPWENCVGSRRVHEHVLEYAASFMEEYSPRAAGGGLPRFAYVHLDEGHSERSIFAWVRVCAHMDVCIRNRSQSHKQPRVACRSSATTVTGHPQNNAHTGRSVAAGAVDATAGGRRPQQHFFVSHGGQCACVCDGWMDGWMDG